MSISPIKITFQNVVRAPLTWALLFIGGLLINQLRINNNINENNDFNCMAEKAEYRNEIKELKKKQKELVNALFIKNGIIDNSAVIIDSLNNKQNDKPE